MKILALLALFFTSSAWAIDTYVFQVDPDSVTAKTLNDFRIMGKGTDREPFNRTYMIQNSTNLTDYYTLKITPQDQAQLDLLMTYVGKGLDIVGIYNLSNGILQQKVDNSDKVVVKKPTAANPE